MKSINFAHFPPVCWAFVFLCGCCACWACCACAAFFAARMAFVDIVITAHSHIHSWSVHITIINSLTNWRWNDVLLCQPLNKSSLVLSFRKAGLRFERQRAERYRRVCTTDFLFFYFLFEKPIGNAIYIDRVRAIPLGLSVWFRHTYTHTRVRSIFMLVFALFFAITYNWIQMKFSVVRIIWHTALRLKTTFWR